MTTTPIYVADSVAAGATEQYAKEIRSERQVNVVRIQEESGTGDLVARPRIRTEDGVTKDYALLADDGANVGSNLDSQYRVHVPAKAPLTLLRPTDVSKNDEFLLDVKHVNGAGSTAGVRCVASTLSAVTLDDGGI